MPLALQNLIHPSLITSKELRLFLCSNAFHSSITIPVAAIIFHPHFPMLRAVLRITTASFLLKEPSSLLADFSTPLQIFVGQNHYTIEKSGKIISLLWSLVPETWRLKNVLPWHSHSFSSGCPKSCTKRQWVSSLTHEPETNSKRQDSRALMCPQ